MTLFPVDKDTQLHLHGDWHLCSRTGTMASQFGERPAYGAEAESASYRCRTLGRTAELEACQGSTDTPGAGSVDENCLLSSSRSSEDPQHFTNRAQALRPPSELHIDRQLHPRGRS